MIFLDTHAIIWRAVAPEKLSLTVRHVLDQEEGQRPLRICEISLFEIAMLMKRGRLNTNMDYPEFMDLILAANDYVLTGINPEIAGLAVNFPDKVNKDPADRIILATAVHFKARLVTADANLRKADVVTTVW